MHMKSLIGPLVPRQTDNLVIFLRRRRRGARCALSLDRGLSLSPRNISTAIVNARVVKQDGQLVECDWKSLYSRITSNQRRHGKQNESVIKTLIRKIFRFVF
ncbi:hypothetical protein BJX99DRAFT_99875 [Aspergillus californicus]